MSNDDHLSLEASVEILDVRQHLRVQHIEIVDRKVLPVLHEDVSITWPPLRNDDRVKLR